MTAPIRAEAWSTAVPDWKERILGKKSLVPKLPLHDAVAEKAAGFPVTPGTPCEGTGYEIGSMSIIKGARNLDNAKKFYDWALTPAAQEIGAANKAFPIPSNKNAKLSPDAPKFEEIKLIDYDTPRWGSPAERSRLLKKFDDEVKGLPR